MKGIICYYSGSGNTKLAINYIKNKIKNVDFELYDIVRSELPGLSKYDIVGFATFTDFWGVPQYFYSFFDEIDPQADKYAFVFNTFGFISGKTLKQFAELAHSKEFNVLCGHSLHTPESYPPMRARNKAYDTSPNPKELKKFDDFILRLDNILETIQSGETPKRERIEVGFIGTVFPAFSRTKAKEDFGEQNIDKENCLHFKYLKWVEQGEQGKKPPECRICEKLCPYEAVQLDSNPVFDHAKCTGCWSCYNHCPEGVIYTAKFKGQGRYPKPSEELKSKLGVSAKSS